VPIYEYECTKCGKIAEVMQKFSDPPLTECRHCHGKLRKLISMSTFHLKGTGWYVTDYAGKKPHSEKDVSHKKTDGGKTEKTTKPSTTKSED